MNQINQNLTPLNFDIYFISFIQAMKTNCYTDKRFGA